MKLQKMTPGRMALWLVATAGCIAALVAITGWANSPLWFLLYPVLILLLLGLILLGVLYLFQRL